MQHHERAALLLDEALHALNLPAGAAYPGETHAWHIALDESSGLDIEYDDAQDRFVITADVGKVAPSTRLASYGILLQYNHLWSETGGVRMALDGSTDQVLAMLDAPLAQLDASRFAAVLASMASVRRTWAQVLEGLVP
jgi:hypothetical protein